jgi:uncharacterized Zn finger protein (UPF0148 family)
MELISNVNCCTTECGHSFHSTCLFKNFSNSSDCPLCRKELVIYSEEEDDEEESNEESIAETETETESGSYLTINQLECAIKKHSFTEKDLLNCILIQEFNGRINISQTMIDRYNKFYSLLDSIYNNEIAVDYRDTRSYLSVLLGVERTDEPGEGPRSIF